MPRYLVTSPVPIENPARTVSVRSRWSTSALRPAAKVSVVIADDGVAGSPDATPVVGDDPVAGLEQDALLFLTGSGS